MKHLVVHSLTRNGIISNFWSVNDVLATIIEVRALKYFELDNFFVSYLPLVSINLEF
jgi:hypothetical protein